MNTDDAMPNPDGTDSPPLDGFGRDVPALRRQFRASLDEVGLDRARMWIASQAGDPERRMWFEEWIAEQEVARRAADDKLAAQKDAKSRRLARAAIYVSIASLLVAIAAWIYPRTPSG